MHQKGKGKPTRSMKEDPFENKDKLHSLMKGARGTKQKNEGDPLKNKRKPIE